METPPLGHNGIEEGVGGALPSTCSVFERHREKLQIVHSSYSSNANIMGKRQLRCLHRSDFKKKMKYHFDSKCTLLIVGAVERDTGPVMELMFLKCPSNSISAL